jgi:hypothetical protein
MRESDYHGFISEEFGFQDTFVQACAWQLKNVLNNDTEPVSLNFLNIFSEAYGGVILIHAFHHGAIFRR